MAKFQCEICGHTQAEPEYYCPRCGLFVSWRELRDEAAAPPPSPPPSDFPKAADDGRCLICEGWGCPACSNTGGY